MVRAAWDVAFGEKEPDFNSMTTATGMVVFGGTTPAAKSAMIRDG